MNRPSYWNHNSAYYPWVAAKTRGCPRVLDVGCGNGELALMLAQAGHSVVGIDPSEERIAEARTRAGSHNVQFICAQLEDCNLCGPFDAIMFVASIHHMDMEQALKRAKELLAPNGMLVIVGLATPSSPLDHVIEALRVIPSAISSKLRRMTSSEELGIPTSYELPTMTQVRQASSRHLPGARIRYGLHWRYLLLWSKA